MTAFNWPEHLRIEHMASTQPGPGEVRLRVRAASVDANRFVLTNEHTGTVIVECSRWRCTLTRTTEQKGCHG